MAYRDQHDCQTTPASNIIILQSPHNTYTFIYVTYEPRKHLLDVKLSCTFSGNRKHHGPKLTDAGSSIAHFRGGGKAAGGRPVTGAWRVPL